MENKIGELVKQANDTVNNTMDEIVYLFYELVEVATDDDWYDFEFKLIKDENNEVYVHTNQYEIKVEDLDESELFRLLTKVAQYY